MNSTPRSDPAAILDRRLRLLRALAAELRAAIGDFAAGSAGAVSTQAAKLEGLCTALAGCPPLPSQCEGNIASMASLLSELGEVTGEVRRLNHHYAVLVREARRTAAALLHHLCAHAGLYSHPAAEAPAPAAACGAELRVSA